VTTVAEAASAVKRRLRLEVPATYSAAAGAAVLAFLLGALLLAVTVPYHDWDSFDFGAWSKQIAQGGSLDPLTAGRQGSGRPLFYLLQGGVWAVTGVSFTAGRVLSLVVALMLILAVAGIASQLARTRERRVLQTALAAVFVVAVAPFAQEAIAGKSDVPAAALVATVIYLALRRKDRPRDAVLLAVAALIAVLAKPTVITELLGLGVWLALEPSRPLRRRIRWSVAPLTAGLALGFVYELVMALRFHTGLVSYLETGTSDGIWAQRAVAERWHAALRLDVFGAGLRLPLAFAIVYCVVRTAGLAHRRAMPAALAAGLAWTIGGPIGAGVPGGAFSTPEVGFAFVGFAVLLLGAVLGQAPGPDRSDAALLAATGLPALALWDYGIAYADRLASPAWPALVVMIAVVCALGVEGLRRLGPTAALAPIPVLAVAVWLSLATLDGFHGPIWSEYRSLGLAGVQDKQRTLNVVLPSLQSALATAEPYPGRMSVSDPRFVWFRPNGTTTTTALKCSDLDGYQVFVLLTSDESEAAAKDQGGLATPPEWAACRQPRLAQLSDGSNGYAVFAVK
jgi:hypothetical protein